MSSLRPGSPTAIATSQERTQQRWGALQCQALKSDLFITLLHILIFGLDPSQAHQLEAHNDPRHVFDPLHPWPEERYAILLHLYWMATTAADESVLALCSEASRPALWSALLQSVHAEAPALTTIGFGSVNAREIQNSLHGRGRSMGLSEVRYWTGRLWHTLPFEPPWRFPSGVDMTLEQESEVTNALGALQGILEEATLEPAFDPEFLTPIALSRFSWSSSILEEWSHTAQATELAFQAAHRMFECQTDRQGMVFLVVVVLVHYFQWRIPPSTPHALGPPSLIFDFSEASFCRSLEALTTYIGIFGLHNVLARPAFALVQSFQPDMSPERVQDWGNFWRDCLPSTPVDQEDSNESVGIYAGKEAGLPEPGRAWFSRLAGWCSCLGGVD